MNPQNNETRLPRPTRNPLKVTLTKMGMRIFYVLSTIIFVLLIALWVGVALMQQAANVTNWTPASATVRERQGSCDTWLLRGIYTAHDTARWAVDYTYQGKAVEGKLCTTGVYTYDYYDESSGSIVKIVPGAVVSVLVNPDNTSEAVLQNGMPANDLNSQLIAGAWSLVAVGLVLVVYIGLTLIPGLRSKPVI